MGDVSQWSSTAGSGYQFTEAPPDGAPETHSASAVNNIMRETMAALRRQWEQKEWFDFGDTPTFLTTSSFRLPDTYESQYTVNRRVRATVSGTYHYGTIASVSSGAGTFDVTLTMDSGSALAAGLTNVELGGEPLASPPINDANHPDPHLLGDGDPTAPTYSYASAPDTGWYLAGDGSLRASVDGALKFRIDGPNSDSATSLPMLFPVGAEATPSVSFSGYTNWGWWHNTASIIGSANGTEVVALATNFFRSRQPIQAPDGTEAAPGFTFIDDPASDGMFRETSLLGLSVSGDRRVDTSPTTGTWLYEQFGTPAVPTKFVGFNSSTPWILEVANGNTDSGEYGGIYLGLKDTPYDGTNSLGGLWISSRRGTGLSSDPNGGFIIGRDSGGNAWATTAAIRWSEVDAAWYIGNQAYTEDKEILTKSQIQAMIDASITSHITALH